MKKIELKINNISLNEKEKMFADAVLICLLFAGTVLITSALVIAINKLIEIL